MNTFFLLFQLPEQFSIFIVFFFLLPIEFSTLALVKNECSCHVYGTQADLGFIYIYIYMQEQKQNKINEYTRSLAPLFARAALRCWL